MVVNDMDDENDKKEDQQNKQTGEKISKGENTMAAMVKQKQGIYEFNVKNECFKNVVDRINEQRLSKDFVDECFRVASKYKKPEKIK